MKIKRVILLLSIFLPLFGCIDEILIDSKDYQARLVVEGTITNEEGPYYIKLYKSSPVNEFNEAPIEGCTVSIIEKSENSETTEILTEVEPGLYRTDKNGVKGTIGNSYKLSILTSNNVKYESNYQEILNPVGIDSVYPKLQFKKTEEYPNGLPGYQFYVTTEMANNNKTYFLWQAEETYEYTVDFELYDIYFGRAELDTNKILRDSIINNYKYNLYRCWNTKRVNRIFTGETSQLVEPQIIKQPLHFVGTDTKKLQEKYSLLLKQITVNKTTHLFWKQVNEQTSEENFLTAYQPYNVTGNINNIDNPEEVIFGYFIVGSIVKKRIFVDSPNQPFYYNKCSLVTDPATIMELYKSIPPPVPFYLIEYSNQLGYGVLLDEICVNCTLEEGNNKKPDFWIQ